MRVANCVQTTSAFAIYALFLEPGGRPGPRRLRRRLRPFLAFFFGPPTAPSTPWTASCTCSRTMSRITVTRVFRRGIEAPLLRGPLFHNFGRCVHSHVRVRWYAKTPDFVDSQPGGRVGTPSTR